MSSQQFITDELNQLQKEILSKNPVDLLQFCANYFNTKLEYQRSQLWQQQTKANAAGINLFPQIDNVNTSVSGSFIANGRQPSFKSPFGDNDPHSNHNEPTNDEKKVEDKAGLFKGGFGVGNKSTKQKLPELDPNDPAASSSGTSTSKNTAKSPSILPLSSSKLPVSFNANRRTSVSAEALNPDKFKSDSWKPPINDLTSSQKIELSKTLASNFLFQQLDSNSKKTVIEALTKKTFSKDTEIIRQGDEGDYFYIIESGTVDFYVNGSKVNSSSEGSSFGELALMYNSPRAATATAASEEVTCWALDRLTFRRILLEGTFNRRIMYEDFLKDVKVLSSLSNHERSKLADALSTEIYHSGDIIVKEGEQGENFYFIESGSCEVSKEGQGVVTNLGKGDYFGEVALLNDLPRQASVIATDNVIVATLGKSGFTRLLGPAVDVLKSQDPRGN